MDFKKESSAFTFFIDQSFPVQISPPGIGGERYNGGQLNK